MSIPDYFFSLLKDIPHRDIWQPDIGRQLITQLQEKEFKLLEHGKNQTIMVDTHWKLHSAEQDIFLKEHIARQHLFTLAQQQKQLQPYLSTQRCLVLLEYSGIWRLWQIIKIEQNLSDLLTSAIAQQSNKETAALLLVSIEKILLAKQQFDELNFYPELSLTTLALQHNKPIFLDFMPSQQKKHEFDLKRTFATVFTDILNLSKADTQEILHYLKLYASNHKNNALLTSLQSLLLI